MAEGLRSSVRYLGSEEFEIKSVEGLSERKEKGRGCYGAVYEVRVHGVPCIAKRLHDILVGRRGEEPVGEKERAGVIQKFCDEVNLLSRLRHPNVVQFLGVHYGCDKADISLIMEYMHMDLEHCITAYPNIPLPYKTSILRDVSYGLAYLHSKSIIHRDLNAGNILLTESLRAKIADLGVAKLFDFISAVHRKTTMCPGAPDFMPPESVDESPKYDYKLDIFSVGHLILYLVNQSVPIVSDKTMIEDDFKRKQLQVGKRRKALIQMGGPNHPLFYTAVWCLSDSPDQRPTTMQLVNRMKEVCERFPVPHKNALETQLEQSRQRDQLEKLTMAVAAKKKELHVTLRSVQAKIQTLVTDKKQLNQKNTCLLQQNAQLSQEKVHLSIENAQLSNKQAQLSKDNALLSQEKAQMSQEKTSILMELSDCKKHTDNERRTNTQLKSSNEVLRSRLEKALSQVKILQDHCNTLKAELEQKEVYCESLRKKLEQSSELGKLTDQVKASHRYRVRQAPTPRPRHRYLSQVNSAGSKASSTNVPTMNHGRADDEMRQAEEERRVKEEEETRQAEQERRRVEEDERRQAEEERKRVKEEERKQAEEERRVEEEERRQAEEERKRVEEEERRQAKEKRRRVEEEERRQAEEERRSVEEEERRQVEEERRRVEEEKRRQAEEERRSVEEEERGRAEEERRSVEEEERRNAKEERGRIKEEERRHAEEERRRVKEEERRRTEEERKRAEEEEKRRAEEERRRVEEEEEEKRQAEEERRRVKEEERRRTEEERKRAEEEKRRAEEERSRVEEEEEERRQAKEERRRVKEEERRRAEQERRRVEEEKMKRLIAEEERKIEEEKRRLEEERRRAEEERRIKVEEDKRRKFEEVDGKQASIFCNQPTQPLQAASYTEKPIIRHRHTIGVPSETVKQLQTELKQRSAIMCDQESPFSAAQVAQTGKSTTLVCHAQQQQINSGLDMSEEELSAGNQLKISNSMLQRGRDINASTPSETAGANSELAKKLEIRRQQSESQSQDTDKMGTPPHRSQQPLNTEALTPSPSKCEIVKEKSGDITLRQIGVKSYEDASKEEGRRRFEETSDATTISKAELPPPPVKSKPSRPGRDRFVSVEIQWPHDKPTMIAAEEPQIIKRVRKNSEENTLSAQAELPHKAATLPRYTRQQQISVGSSDKELTDSTLKGSNSASWRVKPSRIDYDELMKKWENLEQPNAQLEERDNTSLHHLQQSMTANEKHPSVKHNVNKKSY